MGRVFKGFLVLSLCIVLIIVALPFAFSQQKSSLGQYPTIKDYERATGKKITKFNEAPMLAELVKQGKLPPVEKRLPEEPAVVEPVEEVGQYGGTWRRAVGNRGDMMLNARIGYESLVRWDRSGRKVIPNVAKKWTVSDNGKTYTFYLRKGMKWSDGEPFTADDIMFWYEDVVLNKDLTPAFPSWLITGGKPGTVEKVDDFTIRFKFVKPHGLFLEYLATSSGLSLISYPKHYLRQFHPRYTSKEELDKKVKESGFDKWDKLFGAKADLNSNPELPSIRSWILKTPSPTTYATAERNPYYWKIDTQGNQLPYIDKLYFTFLQSTESIVLKSLTGEDDMQFRYLSLANYTLLMENREKGGYQVYMWPSAEIAAFYPNQNVKDPVLRKLFQDRRFRIALSLAINRDEINKLGFIGLGKPHAATSVKGDPYYMEEFAKAYIEYDPKRANKLLDEIGLTKRDKEGFRLRPDGKTLAITINIYPAETGMTPDVWELVRKYLEDIGIKVAIKLEDRSLWVTRTTAGESEIAGYGTTGMHWDVDPIWYVPTANTCYWAPLYGVWYATEGKGGEEPIPEIRELQKLYDQLKESTDPVKKLNLGRSILRSHARNIWYVGLINYPYPIVVKNNFRNVPKEGIVHDWRLVSPGYWNPEQFFIKETK
jgi:peptide/nickel transport system substrate-binding protein